MTLYQLCAVGCWSCFNNRGKIVSRLVYRTMEEARQAMPTFLDNCCGDGLNDLSRESTKVHITELSVSGDESIGFKRWFRGDSEETYHTSIGSVFWSWGGDDISGDVIQHWPWGGVVSTPIPESVPEPKTLPMCSKCWLNKIDMGHSGWCFDCHKKEKAKIMQKQQLPVGGQSLPDEEDARQANSPYLSRSVVSEGHSPGGKATKGRVIRSTKGL